MGEIADMAGVVGRNVSRILNFIHGLMHATDYRQMFDTERFISDTRGDRLKTLQDELTHEKKMHADSLTQMKYVKREKTSLQILFDTTNKELQAARLGNISHIRTHIRTCIHQMVIRNMANVARVPLKLNDFLWGNIIGLEDDLIDTIFSENDQIKEKAVIAINDGIQATITAYESSLNSPKSPLPNSVNQIKK